MVSKEINLELAERPKEEPMTGIPAAATPAKGPSWSDLFEPGVKHALVVGVGIQILQQVMKIHLLRNLH
mgnify:CR=1 FL=1